LISRGELVKKVAKYPHVDDYRRSVQSLDEKQFVSMRFIALELRNHYVNEKKTNNNNFSLNSNIWFSILDKCSWSFDEKLRKNQKTKISTNTFNVLKQNTMITKKI